MSKVYNIGCKDIRIRKSEFVKKTQFLYFATYTTGNSNQVCSSQNLFIKKDFWLKGTVKEKWKGV